MWINHKRRVRGKNHLMMRRKTFIDKSKKIMLCCRMKTQSRLGKQQD